MTRSRARRQGWIWGIATAVALLCGLSYWLHLRSLEASFVRQWPAELARDARMIRFAVSLAQPVYARRCASCHGANLHGDHATGAPDLTDNVWLYGDLLTKLLKSDDAGERAQGRAMIEQLAPDNPEAATRLGDCLLHGCAGAAPPRAADAGLTA